MKLSGAPSQIIIEAKSHLGVTLDADAVVEAANLAIAARVNAIAGAEIAEIVGGAVETVVAGRVLGEPLQTPGRGPAVVVSARIPILAEVVEHVSPTQSVEADIIGGAQNAIITVRGIVRMLALAQMANIIGTHVSVVTIGIIVTRRELHR